MKSMNRIALAATAAAFAGLAGTSASGASDQEFLTKAIKGDNSEIKLGMMAEQKGASSGVRDFGRMLNTDHAKAKSEVLPVAMAHGVSPTDEMGPEAKAEEAKLDGMSGSDFDREFASYMVDDHRKDIADFEAQASSGDTATAGLARRQLPTLRKHLEVAEQLSH